MLTKNMIEKRISDLEHAIVPQSIDHTTIHKGKIDILYWVRNGEESLKTESQINNKIITIREEQLIYEPDNLWYKEKEARIKELKYVLTEEKQF